jgi:NADP-dependent 3-hydroxy acid dehydrogenase YdfG
MNLPFDQEFVILTGATSGIGLATARRLIAAGAEVLGIGRNADKLAEVERELGPRFHPELSDLGDIASRAQLTARIRKLERPVDVFLSNAAECVYESSLKLGSNELRRLFETNVLAAMDLCQTVVPFMRSGSRLVQVSSVAARHLPNAKFSPYAATKAALEQFTEGLRLELHPRGIHVSLIVPGLVDTAIYDQVPNFEPTRRKIIEDVPIWLSAEDVADAIVWVLSRPPHVVVTELVVMPDRQTR